MDEIKKWKIQFIPKDEHAGGEAEGGSQHLFVYAVSNKDAFVEFVSRHPSAIVLAVTLSIDSHEIN